MTSFGRPLRSRAAPAAALLFGCLALASCAHRFAPPEAAVKQAAPPSDPAANALWARSLQSASDTPLKAHVVITTRGESDEINRRSVLEMIEGTGGRFLLTYTAPAEARGRVVVCDGATTWQYEPRSRTVLRRTTHESVISDTASDPDRNTAWRREIEPGGSEVAGRPARVLSIRAGDGKVADRLWIDTQTGRSLRTETYDSKGRIVRSVELSQIAVNPTVTAATFQPRIPSGARVLAAAPRVSTDSAAEVRQLDLPIQTAGYRVQSVVRASRGSRSEVVHVLYSNGPRALSVFVTVNRAGAATQLVPPSDDSPAAWKPAALTPSVRAFTQEQAGGQSAVAWVSDRHRYVAVSRLPLTDLLGVARAMASE